MKRAQIRLKFLAWKKRAKIANPISWPYQTQLDMEKAFRAGWQGGYKQYHKEQSDYEFSRGSDYMNYR